MYIASEEWRGAQRFAPSVFTGIICGKFTLF